MTSARDRGPTEFGRLDVLVGDAESAMWPPTSTASVAPAPVAVVLRGGVLFEDDGRLTW